MVRSLDGVVDVIDKLNRRRRVGPRGRPEHPVTLPVSRRPQAVGRSQRPEPVQRGTTPKVRPTGARGGMKTTGQDTRRSIAAWAAQRSRRFPAVQFRLAGRPLQRSPAVRRSVHSRQQPSGHATSATTFSALPRDFSPIRARIRRQGLSHRSWPTIARCAAGGDRFSASSLSSPCRRLKTTTAISRVSGPMVARKGGSPREPESAGSPWRRPAAATAASTGYELSERGRSRQGRVLA